jgi:hypothetical protein
MTAAPKGLQIDRTVFDSLIGELSRRGRGQRESGAFLLCARDHSATAGWQTITAVAYYDDLDPGSLNGAISFTASGYSALSKHCRESALRVVGDIHTHPGRHVAQSHTDASHPMVAIAGHVAVIAPHFATTTIKPTDLGVHVFGANSEWESHFGPDVRTALRIIEPGLTRRPVTWLRINARRLAERLHIGSRSA